jgi:hypothetical protein
LISHVSGVIKKDNFGLGIMSIAISSPAKEYILVGAGDGQIAQMNGTTLAITK